MHGDSLHLQQGPVRMQGRLVSRAVLGMDEVVGMDGIWLAGRASRYCVRPADKRLN